MSEQTIPPNDYDGARAWYLALMEKWEVNISADFSKLAHDPEPGMQPPAQGTLTPAVLRAALASRLRNLEVDGKADLSNIRVDSLAHECADIYFERAAAVLNTIGLAEVLAKAWVKRAALRPMVRFVSPPKAKYSPEIEAAARAMCESILGRDPIAQAVIEARIQSGAAPSSVLTDRADFLDACLGVRTYEVGEDFDAGDLVGVGDDGKLRRVRTTKPTYNTFPKENSMSESAKCSVCLKPSVDGSMYHADVAGKARDFCSARCFERATSPLGGDWTHLLSDPSRRYVVGAHGPTPGCSCEQCTPPKAAMPCGLVESGDTPWLSRRTIENPVTGATTYRSEERFDLGGGHGFTMYAETVFGNGAPPRSPDMARAEAIDAVTRHAAHTPAGRSAKLYRFTLIGACYSVEPDRAAAAVNQCAAVLSGPHDHPDFHDWFAWYRAAERGGLDGVIQKAGRGDPWGFMGDVK